MSLGPVLFLPALLGLVAGAPGFAEDGHLGPCAALEGAAWRACALTELEVAWTSLNRTAAPALDSALDTVPGTTTLDGLVGDATGLLDGDQEGLLADDEGDAKAGPECPCGLPAHYQAMLDRQAPPASRPAPGPVPTTTAPAPAPQTGESTASPEPRWVVPAVALGALPVAAAFLPGHGLMARLPWRRALALLPLAGLGLFSRIRPDDMFENATRKGIADALRERPGRSIQELRDGLGIAWGTAVYHLERLEGAGLVVSHRTGNHRRYYMSGSPEARHRDGMGVLEADTARRLAQAVMTEPGVTQKGLCARVGIRHPVASKYLKRMEQHMLVTTETRDRFRCYTPTSRLRELAPRLLDKE